MKTKFNEWAKETQDYIKQSLVHIISKSGYVIHLHTFRKVEEDYIFDAIEMDKIYPSVTREKAINTLGSIQNLDSSQSYVIAHIIEYLKYNFAEKDDYKECNICGRAFTKENLVIYDGQLLCDECEEEIKGQEMLMSDVGC